MAGRWFEGYETDGLFDDDVFAGGVGVCQDYAHLAVAMCRSVGIPARYVSGHLFTDREDVGAPAESDSVVVQTLAWFEAAIPGWGWFGLDPTNGQMASEHHVKIGHGRSCSSNRPALRHAARTSRSQPRETGDDHGEQHPVPADGQADGSGDGPSGPRPGLAVDTRGDRRTPCPGSLAACRNRVT